MFYIKFSTKMPEYIKKAKTNIFESVTIDRKFLLEKGLTECKDKLFNSKDLVTAIEITNMILFPQLSIQELKYILAFIFQINASQININILTKEHVCSANKDVKYKHIYSNSQMQFAYQKLLQQSSANMQLYNEMISIGNNFISIDIIKNEDNIINNYENIFYQNYLTIGQYIYNLRKNFKSSDIQELELNPNISNINITCIYGKKYKTENKIDIAKLFNIHAAGEVYNKIYVHSKKIDEYNVNERAMQYIKTASESGNTFKGVEPLFETCVLYIGKEIYKGLILKYISVSENMTLDFSFININTQNTYDNILNTLG